MGEKDVLTPRGEEETKCMPHASHEESTHEDTVISAALTFPEKLWVLVESHQFKSIWWGKNGSCIIIDEEMFQTEVLGRKGSLRIFGTESMKSFIRQLNAYGFTKIHRDVKRSSSLPKFLAQEGAAAAHRKLLCYYYMYFRKDHPELLEHCKRRAAPKRRAVAAPNPQQELNKGLPRSSPGAQPMEGTAAGPEKRLLPADPEAGIHTGASMGPPPPKQPKKARTQAQAGSAPTLPDPAAPTGKEECQPLAPSPLPSSSSPALAAASAPPAYNALPFMAPTFTPGSVWQALPQPPQASELQDPEVVLRYLSQCFAMAMMAAAQMTTSDWGQRAVSHCPTCTCRSDRADAGERSAP
ncbi:HSFY1 protein, partial [Odontophorus gujanensis]|nr:HSFY1 protein [Odontophorus gujanensis]